MIVAIVDYGSGNLRSAAKAFERAAAENRVSAEIKVTSEPETVAGADRVSCQVSAPLPIAGAGSPQYRDSKTHCSMWYSPARARFWGFASACS